MGAMIPLPKYYLSTPSRIEPEDDNSPSYINMWDLDSVTHTHYRTDCFKSFFCLQQGQMTREIGGYETTVLLTHIAEIGWVP